MNRSFRLGHVRGVPVEVHWLFGVLLLWAAWQGWGAGGGWVQILLAPADLLADPAQLGSVVRGALSSLRAAFTSVGLLILLFACVLVHELGHMIHAQALGIPVRRILLLPFGGLAELARLPDRPLDELRVAVAGPAANVALAMIFGALLSATLWGGASPREVILAATGEVGAGPLTILLYLMMANVGLALFNLMPAFPMDGGRILRSLLSVVLRRLTATRLVTGLSWLLGGALVVVGLAVLQRWGWSMALGVLAVGFFTFVGAGAETALEQSRLLLQRIPARAAVRQPTWTVSPTDWVTPGLLTGVFSLKDYAVLPVVVGHRLVGLLLRRDVEAALRRGGRATVAHLMRTRYPYLRADEDLWRAQQLLLGSDLGALPVLDGERLHGLLTRSDVAAARLAFPAAAATEPPRLVSGGNPIP